MLTEGTVIDTRTLCARPEADLVRLAQGGCREAFDVLHQLHQKAILNYIYRLMGNVADAEELCQDTFLKAYLALPKTSDDLRMGPWLYRIATNRCLDELRHRQLIRWTTWEHYLTVFHPSQVAEDNPEQDCLNAERAADVRLVLSGLSPEYARMLELREFRDLSYDEMAEACSATRSAIKSRLFRARRAFQEGWEAMKQGRMDNYGHLAF